MFRAVSLALILCGSASIAQAESTSRLRTAVVTPLAMQYFCRQHPAECRSSEAREVALTDQVLDTLKRVNSQVNRAIRPQRDNADVWELNPRSGDCEDYVLSKRSALVRMGVPAGSLRIAYTHTRRGAPHAILVVRTNQGDLVLDNLNNTIKSLSASGYTIRSMSSSNPKRWVAG